MTVILTMTANADTVVSSPDGRIAVDFDVKGGKPVYKVLFDGKVAISESSLGLVTNIGDYSGNLVWNKEKTQKGTSTGSYSLKNIKKSAVNYAYNTVQLHLSQADKPVMEIEFRAGNSDVAFAYTVLEKGERRSCVITDELTTFNISDNARGFLAPQSE